MRKLQAVIYAVIVVLAGLSVAQVCHAQEVKAFPINGKVLMPDGSPAEGAKVEARSIARGTDWKVDATSTSGANGQFTLQLAQGSYCICAVSGDFVYIEQTDMTNVKADGSLSRPIEIHLEKGCKVEGSVVDISNGKPLGGVKIMTRDGDIAESSESGSWSMVLPKGNHIITAIKEGYWWPIVNFNATGDTASVKVETKPGGTVTGRVLDEQGKPVAGARIRTQDLSYFLVHGAKADADGRFTLGGLDPDSKVLVSVSADGYEYMDERAVTFPAGQREAQMEVVLQKTPLRTITGRVTRPDGSPVEGVKVAYGAGPSWADYTSAKTDKDGRYTLAKARIRKNIVMASGPGFAPVYKPVEAEKDAQIDFQLKPGHTVEGCVEDEDGNPLEGAHLSVSMMVEESDSYDDQYEIAYVQTGKDGKFKLENLPEGDVYARVYFKDLEGLQNERLKVDRKDYTLVLRKTVQGQICGTVVKDADGKPVSEFNVRLDSYQGGISMALMEQGVNFQSADGKFIIKGLKPKESYGVIVTAPGYMRKSTFPVMAKPVSDENYKDLLIRLSPAGSFEGNIKEAGTGKPVEGVIVTAWDTGFGSSGSFRWEMSGTILKSVSTRTDSAGKFRFDSIPFAYGAVQLEKQGFARTFLKNVRFSRPLETILEKGAVITGSVADEQGKVPPGTYLHVDHKDLFVGYADSRSKINPDGSFRVEDLPPGEYFIGQYKDGKPARHQVYELKAGETYQVDWAKQGAAVVEGKVLQNGKPVSNAKISVNSRRAGFNWEGSAETGEDGSYKLSLFKPGKYSFSCMVGEWVDPNKLYTAKTTDIAAGSNRLDFKMPCGSISGKLVDKLTGKPLSNKTIRLFIYQTHEEQTGRSSLHSDDAEPRWWQENECKTDKNGAFKVQNLGAGKWMVCAVLGGKSSRAVPAGMVKLTDGEAKTGVVAKAPPIGSASCSIAGMKELPKGVMVVCVDDSGMVYYPEYKEGTYSMEFKDLPAGNMKAVVRSNDYLQTPVPFKVLAGETTNVSIKLTRGSRVVFRPKSGASEVTDPLSVAFRITTPDGKPVWYGWEGLCWGDVLTSGGPDSPASITIKPGTYLVKAAVRDDPDSWMDKNEITGWSGKINVVAGKDTVVELPWKE